MGIGARASHLPGMPRRAALLAAAAFGLAGVAACGDGGRAATPTTLPPRVAAMWAQDESWLRVAPPDAVYVPGPAMPDDVRVEALIGPHAADPEAELRPTPRPDDAAQTLYADPTSAEPWADRALVVGRVAGFDGTGSFNEGGDHGTPVDIQRSRGRVGRSGDMWFAVWDIPTTACASCSQEAFVIGHGLTREKVLAIAETVRQEPHPRADPASLPDGLKPMGSSPGAEGVMVVGVAPQVLAMRSGDATAELTAWTGDARLYAHLAFWSRTGSPDRSWRDGWMTVVGRGGDVITVSGSPAAAEPGATEVEALTEAAASLVPGDAAAAEKAMADVVRDLGPLPADQHLCLVERGKEGVWTTLSGVAGIARWGLTLEVADGLANYCDDIWFADSGGGPSSASGGRIGPVPPGGVRFGGGGGLSRRDGSSVTVLAGDVPDAAARVVVSLNGEPIDGELADVGPEPGRRWFAAGFYHERSAIDHKIEAVAYDADGNPIASGAQP